MTSGRGASQTEAGQFDIKAVPIVGRTWADSLDARVRSVGIGPLGRAERAFAFDKRPRDYASGSHALLTGKIRPIPHQPRQIV